MKELNSIVDDSVRAKALVEAHWSITTRWVIAAFTLVLCTMVVTCNTPSESKRVNNCQEKLNKANENGEYWRGKAQHSHGGR